MRLQTPIRTFALGFRNDRFEPNDRESAEFSCLVEALMPALLGSVATMGLLPLFTGPSGLNFLEPGDQHASDSGQKTFDWAGGDWR
jgi:hypothetical protein